MYLCVLGTLLSRHTVCVTFAVFLSRGGIEEREELRVGLATTEEDAKGEETGVETAERKTSGDTNRESRKEEAACIMPEHAYEGE